MERNLIYPSNTGNKWREIGSRQEFIEMALVCITQRGLENGWKNKVAYRRQVVRKSPKRLDRRHVLRSDVKITHKEDLRRSPNIRNYRSIISKHFLPFYLSTRINIVFYLLRRVNFFKRIFMEGFYRPPG